ncbi:MAG: hypothetical protein IPK00_17250 [Deltaproteobacteria bacterium]|nr:hypothetical protein [Deltaproteobacteria bacterium]
MHDLQTAMNGTLTCAGAHFGAARQAGRPERATGLRVRRRCTTRRPARPRAALDRPDHDRPHPVRYRRAGCLPEADRRLAAHAHVALAVAAPTAAHAGLQRVAPLLEGLGRLGGGALALGAERDEGVVGLDLVAQVLDDEPRR